MVPPAVAGLSLTVEIDNETTANAMRSLLVAPVSRAPKTLRALGVVILVAGLATPVAGVDRVRAIADWGATQGPALVRGAASLMLATGSFIGFAVAARRRPA